MYTYNNAAYNNYSQSADSLPDQRPPYSSGNRQPDDQDKTVGIGYYGVRKNSQSADSGVRSATTPTSPGEYSMRSVGSPIYNNNQNMEFSPNTWNYLNANLDLSPHPMSPRVPRSSTQISLRSPQRPVSDGSLLENINRSRLSPEDRNTQSRSLGSMRPDYDRSTLSEHSDPNYSGSSKSQREGSRGGVDTGKPTVMTLRQKWEQNRLGPEDETNHALLPSANRNIMSPSPVNRVISPYNRDSINRSTHSMRDTQSILSRKSEGDTLNRSVFSHGEVDRSGHSTVDRDYVNYSVTGSLRRDPLTHRKIPNGVAKPIRNGSLTNSRHSLNWSRLSLRSGTGKVTRYGKGYGVHNSLVNMAVLAILSLAMAILGSQLLFRITSRQTPGLADSDSVLQSNTSYTNLSEVVVALTSIVIMLDLCCLLTCVLQGYFAAKLIKCPQGQERAFCYLKECMPTRFIATVGFFISIPVFLFALMMFIIMEYRSTPAIIAVVVLTIGVSFSISMAVHSIFVWSGEKDRANSNIPVSTQEPNNNKTKIINGELTNQNELSTLV